MSRYENPEENLDPFPDSHDWLDEWRDESRLSPEDAHAMLIQTFAERLAAYREEGTDSTLWVVPFHYTHEDAEDQYHPIGALWIPDRDTQEMVNHAGHLVHYALIIDMESATLGTGIKLPGLQIYSHIDLSGDVPQIAARGSLLVLHRPMREQVERDFAVQLY